MTLENQRNKLIDEMSELLKSGFAINSQPIKVLMDDIDTVEVNYAMSLGAQLDAENIYGGI